MSKPLELSAREKTFSPPIKEIILENFMSYEYARIPLTGGLNLIVGPNGAGKSSVLLAISVAFGQAYTERSRKLSDLIRRGKDIARVSLIFDNRERSGGGGRSRTPSRTPSCYPGIFGRTAPTGTRPTTRR